MVQFNLASLVSPLLVQLKMIMHKAYIETDEWEANISSEMYSKLKNLVSLIPDLDDESFPHRVVPQVAFGQPELLVFVDALSEAMMAMVYAWWSPNHGDKTQLLTAKLRVCPVKHITIPRTKLCAVVMGVRLATVAQESLPFDCKWCWFFTDSSLVHKIIG